MTRLISTAVAGTLPVLVILSVGVSAVTNGMTGCLPGGAASAAGTDGQTGLEIGGWDGEQVANARVVLAVGARLNVPARGQIIALATAVQESGLRNLPRGDADSLGLFQQRPSAGWGSPSQILDPTYAATRFYRALLAIDGWQTMPLTQAAQSVQHSAYPLAYADDEAAATALYTAFRPGGSDLPLDDASLAVAGGRCPTSGGDGLPAAGAVELPPGFALQPGTPAPVATAVAWALGQLGTPYSYGGDCTAARSGDPQRQCDCSSLVQQAYKTAGITLPRTTVEQVRVGTAVNTTDQLLPGDLVFIPGSDGTPAAPGHVALAIAPDLLVQAPTPETSSASPASPTGPTRSSPYAASSPSGRAGGPRERGGAQGAVPTAGVDRFAVTVARCGCRLLRMAVSSQRSGAPALPSLVRPMLATSGPLPSASEDDRWGYEFKWDGVRAVSYLDEQSLRLMTRNDRDVAVSYPELSGLPGAVAPRRAVLDGEIVAFDEHGRTSFGRLQERMHVRDPAAAPRLAEVVPVTYLVFDVLHLDGDSMLDRPYDERRAVLEGLRLSGRSWQVPPWFAGGGRDVLAASIEQRMEGVLAKRLDSRYRPGARAGEWRKVKNVRTQEVLIAGWRRGRGRREGTIGALILGVPGPDGLQHVGGVGTGFTNRALRELATRLAPHARVSSPFRARLPGADVRDVQWVDPVLVGEVEFAEWTEDGHLRHPSWRGLRPDKTPDTVVRES